MKKNTMNVLVLLVGLLLLAACGGDTNPLPGDDAVTVKVTIDGAGSVASDPEGISCTGVGGESSGTCFAPFEADSTVELTATPAEGFAFVGWRGACESVEGDPAICRFAPTIDSVVVATFEKSATSEETVKALTSVDADMKNLALSIAESDLATIWRSIEDVFSTAGPMTPAPLALRTAPAKSFLAAAALRTLADVQPLPTGKFVFDHTEYVWNHEASEDLSFELFDWVGDEERLLRMRIDWDARGAIETVGSPDGVRFQVPTGVGLVVDYAGKQIGQAGLDLDWNELGACADAVWPSEIVLAGEVGIGDARLVVHEARFGVTDYGDGELDLDLHVDVEAAAGRDSVRLAGDADVSGRIAGEDACDVESFVADGGSVDAELTTTNHVLALGVGGHVRAEDDALVLSDGTFAIDDREVRFGGVVDGTDANGNYILGEGVVIEFGDGNTTLEDFLIEHFVESPVGPSYE